ncbi:MAG: hypothetical protein V4850_02955 [Myxococcota bacterium]
MKPLSLILLGLSVLACAGIGSDKAGEPTEFEGDATGECDDGADNDRDGAFDCGDSDCGSAPDCEESDADTDADTDSDTDTDTDTDSDTDTDTDTDTDPTYSGEMGLAVESGPSTIIGTFTVTVRERDGVTTGAGDYESGGGTIDVSIEGVVEGDTFTGTSTLSAGSSHFTIPMSGYANSSEFFASGSERWESDLHTLTLQATAD